MDDKRPMQREFGEKATGSGLAKAGVRPFLQVWYVCSGQYHRAYRSVDGSGYMSRCPKCGKGVRFKVGEQGVSSRRFEVDCGR